MYIAFDFRSGESSAHARSHEAISAWTALIRTFHGWVRALAEVLPRDRSALVVPDDFDRPVTLLFRDARLGTVPSINTTTTERILTSARFGDTTLAFHITLWVCAFLAAEQRFTPASAIGKPASAIGKPTTPPLGLECDSGSDEEEEAIIIADYLKREYTANVLSPARAASDPATLETLQTQRAAIKRLLEPGTPCSEIFNPLIALAMAFKIPARRSSVISAAPPHSPDQAYSLAIAGWTLIFPDYEFWVISVSEQLPHSVADFERFYDHHNPVPLLLGDESLGNVRHIAAKHQERLIDLAGLDGTIPFAMGEFLSGACLLFVPLRSVPSLAAFTFVTSRHTELPPLFPFVAVTETAAADQAVQAAQAVQAVQADQPVEAEQPSASMWERGGETPTTLVLRALARHSHPARVLRLFAATAPEATAPAQPAQPAQPVEQEQPEHAAHLARQLQDLRAQLHAIDTHIEQTNESLEVLPEAAARSELKAYTATQHTLSAYRRQRSLASWAYYATLAAHHATLRSSAAAPSLRFAPFPEAILYILMAMLTHSFEDTRFLLLTVSGVSAAWRRAASDAAKHALFRLLGSPTTNEFSEHSKFFLHSLFCYHEDRLRTTLENEAEQAEQAAEAAEAAEAAHAAQAADSENESDLRGSAPYAHMQALIREHDGGLRRLGAASDTASDAAVAESSLAAHHATQPELPALPDDCWVSVFDLLCASPECLFAVACTSTLWLTLACRTVSRILRSADPSCFADYWLRCAAIVEERRALQGLPHSAPASADFPSAGTFSPDVRIVSDDRIARAATTTDAVLRQFGYASIPTPRDGNCFLHAVQAELQRTFPDQGFSAGALRQAIARISATPEVQALMSERPHGEWQRYDSSGNPIIGSHSVYSAFISQNRTWCGTFEAALTATYITLNRSRLGTATATAPRLIVVDGRENGAHEHLPVGSYDTRLCPKKRVSGALLSTDVVICYCHATKHWTSAINLRPGVSLVRLCAGGGTTPPHAPSRAVPNEYLAEPSQTTAAEPAEHTEHIGSEEMPGFFTIPTFLRPKRFWAYFPPFRR